MSEAFDKRLQELLSDNIRGSRAIAADAAGLFLKFLEDGENFQTDIVEFLSDACTRLRDAHPSLLAVQRLCEAVEAALAGEESGLKTRVVDVLDQWRSAHSDTALLAMAEHLLPLNKPGCRILCHSHSSTVLGVLKHMKEKLGKFSVVQTVSYPMKEGIRMAEELADAGINVCLIADAGAAKAVGECDLVLLGADSIHRNGIVNKLGSFGIALAAKHFGVPVYVVADSSKLTRDTDAPEFEQHDPAELSDLQHSQINVDNVYFDITPVELFAGIVTEKGYYEFNSFLRD